MQENLKKLSELQQKHENEISALTSDLERERTRLENDHKENEKSLQTALDSKQSKLLFRRVVVIINQLLKSVSE